MSLKAHRIVTRAANRVLVGTPLCRNEVRAAILGIISPMIFLSNINDQIYNDT